MANLPTPDWAKLCEAIYPHLSAAERQALTKIWETNHARFAPLKSQLRTELDPDFVFDPQP